MQNCSKCKEKLSSSTKVYAVQVVEVDLNDSAKDEVIIEATLCSKCSSGLGPKIKALYDQKNENKTN